MRALRLGRREERASGREERKRRPREEGVNPFWAQRVQLSQNKRSMARPRESIERESARELIDFFALSRYIAG